MDEPRLRIGVITSGGDAPGMNAALRAVVRTGLSRGHSMLAFMNGWSGVVFNEHQEMVSRSVSDIIHRGGSIIGCGRCPEMFTPEGVKRAVQTLKHNKVDALVVIGGDGSYQGALKVAEHGVRVIGLPGTIDNDIPGTEYTIGFDTTCNTVVDCLNKIRDTASSFNRAFIVEVMGRDSGWIALVSGLAGGAEAILIPESKYDIEDLAFEMNFAHRSGKRHFIIVVAEGCEDSHEIKHKLEERAAEGVEIRLTILGHLQRGGCPSAQDRLRASQMGAESIFALEEREDGIMIGIQKGDLVRTPLKTVIESKQGIDPSLMELAEILSQ